MVKKYLKKKAFKYNTHPSVLKKNNRGHVSYITARKRNKSKVNVITHSSTFFDSPTKPLLDKPEKSGSNKKVSRFSEPRWISDSYLQEPKGTWKMSHRDDRRIRNANKKFARTGKW